MRKVVFQKHVSDGKGKYSFEDAYGLFHCWGLEESEGVNYSVAVIEHTNGDIYTVLPWRVRFVDKED